MDLITSLYELRDPKYDHLHEIELPQFIGWCLLNMKDSHAQNYQDLWALYEFIHKFPAIKEGFFVEFGASDGITGNNTYLLETKHKWDGLLIEPHPMWLKKLRNNRKCSIDDRCIYTSTGSRVEFVLAPETAADLSTIEGYGQDDQYAEVRKLGERMSVPTITLKDVLVEHNAPGQIDYISVDTEGSEYDILVKFFEENQDTYVVHSWTIEHNFNDEVRNKIYQLMTANGYERVFSFMSRWDDFYRRKNLS